MILGSFVYSKTEILIILIIICVWYVWLVQNSNIKYFRGWKQTTQRDFHPEMNDEMITLKNYSSENQDTSANGDELGQSKKRLPSCLIIGAKKSGTAALRTFLNIHPKIRVANFELHFFNKDSNYYKGFAFYRKQMPISYKSQITIEQTPNYLISELALKRIHDFNSGINLLVILRHPVKRMISDYWHVRRMDKIRGRPISNLSFEQLAFDNQTGEVNMGYQAVNISLYYFHIKRYLEYFPRHQLHVVDGDNFILNPVEEISKVENFLGLEHSVTKDKVYFDENKGFFCYVKGGEKHCLQSTKGNTHPPIQDKYFSKLNNFFEPFNKKLYKLIGQKFLWL